MVAFVSHPSVDCADAFALSQWWKPVLGCMDIEDDPNEPGDEQCVIRDPDTVHWLLFIEMPDAAKRSSGAARIDFTSICVRVSEPASRN